VNPLERRTLDLAVQALVDFDQETERRTWKRWDLVKAIVNEMQQLGHYPCLDCDPVVFRCGSIIVTAKSDRLIEWSVIEPLKKQN
jgi:hypothetical protein